MGVLRRAPRDPRRARTPRRSPRRPRRRSAARSPPATGRARRGARRASGFVDPSSRQMTESLGPGTPGQDARPGRRPAGCARRRARCRRRRGGSPARRPRSPRGGGASGGGSPPLDPRDEVPQRRLGDDVHRAVVDRHAAVDRARRWPPTRCASACAVPATSQSRNVSVSGWRAAERAEDADDVVLGLHVRRPARRCRCGRSSASRRSSSTMSAGWPGRDQRQPGRAAAVHEEAVERAA